VSKITTFLAFSVAGLGLLMVAGRTYAATEQKNTATAQAIKSVTNKLPKTAQAIRSVTNKLPTILRDTIMGTPRGIRQNNPGNIRPGDEWNGKTGQDGGYLIFSDMRYGIRAMVKVLRNYKRLHGIDTIRGIIYRWAPPADNNPTDSYVKHVAEYLGVGINQKINVDDHMVKLITVISKHENGGDYLTDQQIKDGIEWAG
jgi:hypothetical protein